MQTVTGTNHVFPDTHGSLYFFFFLTEQTMLGIEALPHRRARNNDLV